MPPANHEQLCGLKPRPCSITWTAMPRSANSTAQLACDARADNGDPHVAQLAPGLAKARPAREISAPFRSCPTRALLLALPACEMRMNNLGPHIEQKWASCSASLGKVSS